MRRVRSSVIRDGQDMGAAGCPQKAPAWRGHGRSAWQNATRPLKQGTLTLATTWTDLGGAVLGEVSQTGTDTARPRGHVGPRKRLTGKRSEPWSLEAGRGKGSRRRLHGRVSPGDTVHSAGAAASMPCDVGGAVKGADPERPPQRERRPSSSSPSWGDGETCPCCANDITAHGHAPHHELAR